MIDANVTANGKGTVTTGTFSTVEAGEQLFAFVSADGPSGSKHQTETVSGGGLTWTLVQRANTRAGDAEIWTATAIGSLLGCAVTATPSLSGYDQTLTVVSMRGAAVGGASAAGGAATGASTVSVKATEKGSLVFAVGHDWTSAVARTLATGQVLLHQFLDTAAGDTTWTQYTGAATGAAGETVTMSDTAPDERRMEHGRGRGAAVAAADRRDAAWRRAGRQPRHRGPSPARFALMSPSSPWRDLRPGDRARPGGARRRLRQPATTCPSATRSRRGCSRTPPA